MDLDDKQLKAYKIISERIKQIELQIDALEKKIQSDYTEKQLKIWRELHADNRKAMELFCGESVLIQ